jgi:KDO2-lipid IV(A) lauroyltransferase
MIASLLAHALRALAWLAGFAGGALRQRIALAVATREVRRQSARARVVACNLRLAALDPALAEAAIAQTLLTFLESLRFWTRPRAENLREVIALEDDVERCFPSGPAKRGRPLVVVGPHLGNWELLVQWLAAHGPFTLLYTRGKSLTIDRFLRRVRERSGVTALPADAHGLKPLLRALKRGETVGIMPDQTPDGPGGRWSTFFGVPTLTMTLLHRLAMRHPEAQFVLAAAMRRPDGRFELRIEPLPPAVTSGPVQGSVDALNLAIETMVRRDPTQYQWTYKRFKGQRPGEPLVNPYWPECY